MIRDSATVQFDCTVILLFFGFYELLWAPEKFSFFFSRNLKFLSGTFHYEAKILVG